MRTTKLTLIGAGTLFGAVLTLLSYAGAGEKKEPDKPAPPLTHQSLHSMLGKLGHEPRIWGNNKTNYELAIQVGTFRAVFSVYLSDDQLRFWFVGNSAQLVDVKKVPPRVLVKLMQWNQSNAPFHFTLDEKAGHVYLQMSVPNQGITSAFLNQNIENMADNIKDTWPDWKYDVLQPPVPVVDGPAAGKERTKFHGVWTVHSLTNKGETKTAELFKGYTYTFDGIMCHHGNPKKSVQVAIDPEKSPAHLDFRNSLKSTEMAIYKFDGDTLTICMDNTGKTRPESFEAGKDSVFNLLVLKRKLP